VGNVAFGFKLAAEGESGSNPLFLTYAAWRRVFAKRQSGPLHLFFAGR
jgi:hypothetical protein